MLRAVCVCSQGLVYKPSCYRNYLRFFGNHFNGKKLRNALFVKAFYMQLDLGSLVAANAQIVGTQSYGKGVMQKTHKLMGGAAIKITVTSILKMVKPSMITEKYSITISIPSKAFISPSTMQI